MTISGQKVRITFEGRTVDGEVMMGSDNRKSLMLKFEALLGGYAGMMPVLQDENAVYRDLIQLKEVKIEWLQGS